MIKNEYNYWNNKALKKLEKGSYKNRKDQDEMNKIAKFIFPKCGVSIDSVLDLGCGFGVVATSIINYLSDMIINYYMLEQVEYFRAGCQKHTGILPGKWEAPKIPFEDGSISLVFTFSVLMHCTFEDAYDIIEEMYRVSNRYIVFSEYTGESNNLAPHNYSHNYFEIMKMFDVRLVLRYKSKTPGREILFYEKI